MTAIDEIEARVKMLRDLSDEKINVFIEAVMYAYTWRKTHPLEKPLEWRSVYSEDGKGIVDLICIKEVDGEKHEIKMEPVVDYARNFGETQLLLGEILLRDVILSRKLGENGKMIYTVRVPMYVKNYPHVKGVEVTGPLERAIAESWLARIFYMQEGDPDDDVFNFRP